MDYIGVSTLCEKSKNWSSSFHHISLFMEMNQTSRAYPVKGSAELTSRIPFIFQHYKENVTSLNVLKRKLFC